MLGGHRQRSNSISSLTLKSVTPRTADFPKELQQLFDDAVKLHGLVGSFGNDSGVNDFLVAIDAVKRLIVRVNRPEVTKHLASHYADKLFAAQAALAAYLKYVESSSGSLVAVLASPMRRRHIERLSLQLIEDFSAFEKLTNDIIRWSRGDGLNTSPPPLDVDLHSELVLDKDARQFWQRCFGAEAFVGDVGQLLKRLHTENYVSSLDEASRLLDFFGEIFLCLFEKKQNFVF
jgi:hypothetical protein